jgi:hypothetical protein
MAYATVDDLADALDIRVTDENTTVLQSCLDAAAAEVDQFLEDSIYAAPLIMPTPVPALVVRTNVNRAVEWWKAPATYNGGVGIVDTGTLVAPKSGFERHWAALMPLRIGAPSGIA